MSGPYPTSLFELIARIELHREPLTALVDDLPPAKRDELRDQAGWSTKDHVVHLSMWERSLDFLLTGRARHEGLGVRQETYLKHDVDLTNDEIFRQHRDRDWVAIRAEFDDVHSDLLTTLGGVGWDGLQLTYSHYAPGEPGEEVGTPVVFYVAGNTFFHYDEHRSWIETLVATAECDEGGSL